MPLLQQENSGPGGSRENRRSFTKFLGLDTSQSTDAVAAPKPSSGHKNEQWHWDLPHSPEAAETPGSLVPSNCFPPRHPTAYTSYSERARPGSWAESGQGITDLVASLSLTMPSASSDYMPGSSETQQTQITRWSQTVEHQSKKETRKKDTLARRASFCGVVSSNSGMKVWTGQLPARTMDSGVYSSKVFLGGLPWDVSEYTLMQALKSFRPIRVEWPGRGNGSPAGNGDDGPRGFAYVTFENEQNVRSLLSAARRNGEKWYYRISTRNMKSKEVEVIPWSVKDSICVVGGSTRLDPSRTVFVGALHGMMSAEALAHIMNYLFKGVVYAGIDTDKYKYPIGSGRVSFDNTHSYVSAISAGFVEIRTDKFTKKVQVDPYIEDAMCSMCNMQQGPYFCRSPFCFKYFCRKCWPIRHPIATPDHRALMRNYKTDQVQPVSIPGSTLCQNGNMAMSNRRQSLCDQNIMFGVYSNVDSTSSPTSGISASSDHGPEITDW
ncbi:cytoplasmic polyadenylation element-binding protein 1 [Pieris rapae]|uniref:cytoplasmic polyadenylation element-binding protein 1 n=1 Tax=Pieris rapae TaxID=64459 RepID=UPI001E27EC23|nr:cytoplasmic polyadenylation element-binding protein 1 [Pieris rapae]